MLTRKISIFKHLAVFISVVLLAGCSEKETSVPYKLCKTIDISTVSAAANILGLDESKLSSEEKYSLIEYAAESCPELIPEGLKVDSAALYLDFYDDSLFIAQLTAIREETPDVGKIYDEMAAQCEAVKELYPESAFSAIYEGIGAVDGESPLPFTEKYQTRDAFISAAEKAFEEDIPVLEAEEIYWADKEKEITVSVHLRLTPSGEVYTFTAQNQGIYETYLEETRNIQTNG